MLADAHGQVDEARHVVGEAGQLVEMGGEQSAAAVGIVEPLDAGLRDGEAVIGRRAASDLVEDDEAALGRLIEDRRRLDHLDHEGGAAAREIVGRADAAEQAIDHADAGGSGRHEGAHLGERGDEGVLAQIRGFAGHVGAGDDGDAAALPGRA